MTSPTGVREFLRQMADEVPLDPVEARPAVRRAKRRLVKTIIVSVVAVAALAAGTVVGVERLIAAPPLRPAHHGPNHHNGPPAGIERGTVLFIRESASPRPRLYSMSAGASGPHVIPTGHLFLLAAARSPDGGRIALLAQKPQVREIPKDQLYLMNADGSGLHRIPVCSSAGCHALSLSWSPDGRTILLPGLVGGVVGIHAVDVETGDARTLTAPTGFGNSDDTPVWSPDGRRIAFTRSEPAPYVKSQIWVMNSDGTGAHQLTHIGDAQYAAEPSWSPNGTRLAYSVGGGRAGGVFVMNADGSASREMTACPSGGEYPAWSPDGRSIAVLQTGSRPHSAIAVIDAQTGECRVVQRLPFIASNLTWRG